jgi:trk system potassium uptake protein TrkH
MHRRPLSPAQVLAISFGGLITVGTALLYLPFSSATGESIPLVDALFTATSAVCVTGLIVVDMPKTFSGFGQVVLLLLIQAGGLGYMTLSTAAAVALGKRMTFQERLALREALNVGSMEGLVRFALNVLRLTVAFEIAGAIILTLRWAGEFGLAKAAYLGLFHAVSAFNNAGFSLFSTNLMAYRGDAVVSVTIAGLIICGGLGFLVLSELGRVRRWALLSVHSRLVLVVTTFLLVGGTVAIFLLERSNPASLQPAGLGEAWLASFFQAVTPRTAGFNTLDIATLTPPALFLIIVLMFIGASPGGTGGGVKTSTFGVTVLALWTTVRGDTEPVLFKRRLSPDLVARSFFICTIAFLTLTLIAALVLIVERQTLLPALFETTSAFGTVGLSMSPPGSVLSLSGSFTPPGKLLVAAMMFMGRVGPLTLAIAVVGRQRTQRLRYPEGKVLIG